MWQPSSSALVEHELVLEPASSPSESDCPHETELTDWWPLLTRMHSGSVVTGLSIRRCGHGSDECLACQAPQVCKSLSSPLTLPLTSDLRLRARKPREGRALSTVLFIHGKRQASLAHYNLDESWSLLTHRCTHVGFFESTNRKMLIWFSNEIKALSLIDQDSHYGRACTVTCVVLLSLAGCVALGRMHVTLGMPPWDSTLSSLGLSSSEIIKRQRAKDIGQGASSHT